jgi:hypothetical protein
MATFLAIINPRELLGYRDDIRPIQGSQQSSFADVTSYQPPANPGFADGTCVTPHIGHPLVSGTHINSTSRFFYQIGSMLIV